jgi:ABC-type branched-subunit amino acid transport system ATPase component/branched-subunit amino acid ABC-type transport system permease component
MIVFALFGLATGALYTLNSLGMVLTYRGTGVINFASGAVGMVGTFAYWLLGQNAHLPTALAVLGGVAVSGALGFLIYLLMRPLREASNLTRVVLTLALLVAIVAIVQIKYSPADSYTVNSFLPLRPLRLLGTTIGEDRLWLIAISIVLTAVIYAIYRYTKFGLATSAAAENGESLANLGWSPDAIACGAWVLGGMLAGLAGILLSPETGLYTGLATDLLLPCLAAAVLGGFKSFPLTVVGALCIGIAQDELLRWSSVQGIGDAVPFGAIFLIILIRGRKLPLRDHVNERLPRVTSGQVNWKKVVGWTAAGIIAIYWLLPAVWVSAVTATIITAVVLESIVVITGFAGQISLAQWSIAGCGALVSAHLLQDGWPVELAIIAGVLSGIPVGLLVGVAALRARGMSLAIATLAFDVCVVSLVLSNSALNGGIFGLTVGSPTIFGISIDATLYPKRFAVFVLLIFVLTALVVANLRRGRVGRRLLAIRANERGAAALGVDVMGSKLAAFCYAAMIGSLGGILTILRFPTALFSTFDSFTSVTLVANSVVGGLGFTTGPLAGGVGETGGVGDQIANLFNSNDVQYAALAFALLTVFVITRAPDGIVPMQAAQNAAIARLLRRGRTSSRTPAKSSLAAYTAVTEATGSGAARPRAKAETSLVVEQISVVFGGVKAVTSVSLELRSGEVLGVIGPNGAGKTTLLDAVTGIVRPRSGRLVLNGADISAKTVMQRSRAGIARAFQSLELFEDMTVLENILVACDHGGPLVWVTDLIRPGARVLTPAAQRAVTDLGLENALDLRPDELSYGQRRLLAIARAIASEPVVLLLDEPGAGLDDRERRELALLITRLAADWGMAILLIDHDVDLVSGVSDRMMALNFGEVIATGTPAEVCQVPAVKAAYLGVEADDEAAEDEAGPVDPALAVDPALVLVRQEGATAHPQSTDGRSEP